MTTEVYERCGRLGAYMLKNHSTVRETAHAFKMGKTTVHNDVTKRLKSVNPMLAGQVGTLLEMHKAQSHIRGGEATKRKYESKN